MIKLRELLNERMNNLKDFLPNNGYANSYVWSVVGTFKLIVATGKTQSSNVYYGSSNISYDPGQEISAQKEDFLIQVAGGNFIWSPKRNKAWKILVLGDAGTMDPRPADSPRTDIPKNKVNFLGDTNDTGLQSNIWWPKVIGK